MTAFLKFGFLTTTTGYRGRMTYFFRLITGGTAVRRNCLTNFCRATCRRTTDFNGGGSFGGFRRNFGACNIYRRKGCGTRTFMTGYCRIQATKIRFRLDQKSAGIRTKLVEKWDFSHFLQCDMPDTNKLAITALCLNVSQSMAAATVRAVSAILQT